MRSEITPGETSDYRGFDLVMDDNLPEPCVLLADRGYDSDKVRETMEARYVVPVIPMRKSRKLCVAVDRTLYRLRNLVERCFNKLKNARRVATRYDKTAVSFLGFIDNTTIRIWFRHPVHAITAQVWRPACGHCGKGMFSLSGSWTASEAR
jgi:transposase